MSNNNSPFEDCIVDDPAGQIALTPGARFSNIPETFRARKATSKTTKPLMYRAFYANTFWIYAKLALMQRFESKNLFGFSATDF